MGALKTLDQSLSNTCVPNGRQDISRPLDALPPHAVFIAVNEGGREAFSDPETRTIDRLKNVKTARVQPCSSMEENTVQRRRRRG
ncbi:hypothetical protein OSTOST_05482 [Ostertagia ostertagi]